MLTTNWPQLRKASQRGSPEYREALSAVLERYRPAMVEFLVRSGVQRTGAEDVVQSFVIEKILERDFLARADPARGRFRDLLRRSLRNFARSRMRRREPPLPPDDGAGGVLGEPDDEGLNAEWARIVVDEAVRQMKAECESTSKQHVWWYFWYRELRPIREERPPPSLAELAELMAQAGYPLGNPDNARRTARQMFARVLREIVGEYEGAGGDYEEEIRDLMRRLRGADAKQ